MKLAALAMAIVLPSCTAIGGSAGGFLANHHNNDLPDMHDPSEERSVALWVLIPALVGLVCDVTYLNLLARQWSTPLN